MSFNAYRPFRKKNTFPKYVIVFMFGLSFALFFSSAFTIVTGINNAVQYIKQIVLTSDGTIHGTTGIVLDGVNRRIGIGITPLYPLHVDGNADINGIFMADEARLGTSISNGSNLTVQGGANINNKFYVTGSKVGIGINNPQADLDLNGDLEVSGTGNISTLLVSKGIFSSSIRVPGVSSAPGSSNTCTSAGVGAIRYEGSLMELCVCDGSNRKKIYSGSLVCIPGLRD